MMTYLLDTSAWLAHIFDETGAEEVEVLFDDPEKNVVISAISILEVYTFFRHRDRVADFAEMLEFYRLLLSHIYPADESVILRAIALRQTSTRRLPALDSIIAATAAHHNAVLVHRDGHFAAVAAADLRQQPLR